MSQREDARSCPRCDRLLLTRESRGGDGLTLVWQCPCGWAAARTVSRDAAFVRTRAERHAQARATRGSLAGSERADQSPRAARLATQEAERATKLEES